AKAAELTARCQGDENAQRAKSSSYPGENLEDTGDGPQGMPPRARFDHVSNLWRRWWVSASAWPYGRCGRRIAACIRPHGGHHRHRSHVFLAFLLARYLMY